MDNVEYLNKLESELERVNKILHAEYGKGFEEGRKIAHQERYQKGYEDGFAKGRHENIEALKSTIRDIEHNAGFQDGYKEGKRDFAKLIISTIEGVEHKIKEESK